MRRIPCIIPEQRCNYIHGEIVVIGDGEICQFTQVHVPSSNSIHNEDFGGEAQSATCRYREKHKSYCSLLTKYGDIKISRDQRKNTPMAVRPLLFQYSHTLDQRFYL